MSEVVVSTALVEPFSVPDGEPLHQLKLISPPVEEEAPGFRAETEPTTSAPLHPPTATEQKRTENMPPVDRNKIPEAHISNLFTEWVASKKLGHFFPKEDLKSAVVHGTNMANKLLSENCTKEYARSLSLLVLYDIVMLVDDSSSMEYEQDGQRKETLKRALEEVTKVYDHANPTGVKAVRFLNTNRGKKEVTFNKVANVFKGRQYSGDTRIGTGIQTRILKDFVYKLMKKPLIVMVITDGAVEGEKPAYVKHVIKQCMEKVADDPTKGEGAVVFNFSRVGDDEGAIKLLDHLDNCEEIGKYVDCLKLDTPLERIGNAEDKWRVLVKFLLGATDERLDAMELDFNDEEVDEIDYDAAKSNTEDENIDD